MRRTSREPDSVPLSTSDRQTTPEETNIQVNNSVDPLQNEEEESVKLARSNSIQNANEEAERRIRKLFTQITDQPTDEDGQFAAEEEEDMTRRSEIWAFYLYDWANSAFSGVGITLMFPIMLSSFAEAHACIYESEFGCDLSGSVILSNRSPRVSMQMGGNGGWELKPSSYAAAMISLSGLFQVFFYMGLGSLADYERYQQYGLWLTGSLGGLLTALWAAFDGTVEFDYLGLGWIGIFTICLFGVSIIFYNAYLPMIVDHHWLTLRAVRNGVSDKAVQRVRQAISDDVSQFGFAFGYLGTFFAIVVALGMAVLFNETTTGVSKRYGSVYSSKTASQYSVDLVRPMEDDNDEYYVKLVSRLEMVVYNETSDDDSILSNVAAMRMIYLNGDLNGSWFGNESARFRGDTETVSVDTTKVCKVHIHLSELQSISNPQTKGTILSGLQFEQKDGSVSQLYGVSSNDDSNNDQSGNTNGDKVRTVSFCDDKLYLGGMNAAVIRQSDNDEDAQSISAVSFAFVIDDGNAGQFGHFLSSRMAMLFTGLWWLGFGLLSFCYLHSREGPPLPSEIDVDDLRGPNERRDVSRGTSAGGSKSTPVATAEEDDHMESDCKELSKHRVIKVNPFTFSWVQLFVTLREAKNFPNLFIFLLTFFMFSDGLGTIGSCGVLFAQDELGFEPFNLILLLLIAQISAVFGGVFWIWLQKKFEIDPKSMLLFHIAGLTILPLYAMFGLIDGAGFGIVTPGEMYLFVMIYGINLGSIQSYSRSIFASMIPIGRESEFFAFYEFTDKGSSWIGPLMIALVSNVANMRWALFYVAFFFLLPFPIIYYYVDVPEGIRQSGRKLEHSKDDDDDLERITRKPKEKKMRVRELPLLLLALSVFLSIQISVSSALKIFLNSWAAPYQLLWHQSAAFGPSDGNASGILTPMIPNIDGCNVDELNRTELRSKPLKGRIALIRRGNCSFESKVWNSQYLGASAAIVFNSETDADYYVEMGKDSSMSNQRINIPSALILYSDGSYLWNLTRSDDIETVYAMLDSDGSLFVTGLENMKVLGYLLLIVPSIWCTVIVLVGMKRCFLNYYGKFRRTRRLTDIPVVRYQRHTADNEDDDNDESTSELDSEVNEAVELPLDSNNLGSNPVISSGTLITGSSLIKSIVTTKKTSGKGDEYAELIANDSFDARLADTDIEMAEHGPNTGTTSESMTTPLSEEMNANSTSMNGNSLNSAGLDIVSSIRERLKWMRRRSANNSSGNASSTEGGPLLRSVSDMFGRITGSPSNGPSAGSHSADGCTGRQPTNDACAICLEDFLFNDNVKLLPCNHGFHPPCIDPWLQQSSELCPMCKQSIFMDRIGEGV